MSWREETRLNEFALDLKKASVDNRNNNNDTLCIQKLFFFSLKLKAQPRRRRKKIVYSQVHFKNVFLDLVAGWMHFNVFVFFIGRGLANIEITFLLFNRLKRFSRMCKFFFLFDRWKCSFSMGLCIKTLRH